MQPEKAELPASRQEALPVPADASCSVVATDDHTSGGFAVVAVRLPPHDPGIAPHYHARHAEGCYVLEGTLALTQDECTTILTSGAASLVLPGMLHTYWNPTAAPTTVLLIYRPGASAAEALALAMGAPAAQI